MKDLEKNLTEAISELKSTKKKKKKVNEMAAEASPQGWTIKVGSKRMPPAQLEGEAAKAFNEVRQKIKDDGLMPKIRKEYSTNPKDIVFKAGGVAEVYDDDGNHLKTYKLKHKAV